MSPDHYSRDIPLRCEHLLKRLLPVVDADHDHFGGPLTTTFLLAMATPMVVLPVERLIKRVRYGAGGVADDSELDERLGSRVAEVLLPGKRFHAAPFFEPDVWSRVVTDEPFNVAQAWPHELLGELSNPRALRGAEEVDAWSVAIDLRKALAHGGVTYLDQKGWHTTGPVSVLAFAGAKMAGNKVVGLNLLRIDQGAFRRFLSAWAHWLADTGVVEATNWAGVLAA